MPSRSQRHLREFQGIDSAGEGASGGGPPPIAEFLTNPTVNSSNLPTNITASYELVSYDVPLDTLGIFAIVKVGAYPVTAQDIWDVYNAAPGADDANIGIGTTYLIGSSGVVNHTVASSTLSITPFGALSSNVADYKFYYLIADEGAAEPLANAVLYDIP